MLGKLSKEYGILTAKKWHRWLAPAEWWYNTSFHTSLNMMSFQALYGKPTP
jgi:hypothetical protein